MKAAAVESNGALKGRHAGHRGSANKKRNVMPIILLYEGGYAQLELGTAAVQA